ncbi:nicastrin [Pieris napi]|uniref:nicastrin n=1 Tax=Pieris napi TaxID=78633 RepID=UPI001FBB88C2|nr:nicastrin [Pieris napi]
MNLYYAFIVCVTYFTQVSQCERLHGQIYSSIEGSAACFRRLNGTHQMGCSSSDGGAVGIVQMIKDVEDAQWIIKNASSGPYVAVVSTSLFQSVINLLIDDPSNVAGVLLYDNATMRPSSFSQESKCPNEYSAAPGSTCSSSGETVWNTKGTGLLRKDIPFPIFFVPDSKTDEIEKIEKCYNRYNLDKSNQVGVPLCSVQLHSFMYAAVNTAVCLRRSASSAFLTPTKVCDPLGDYNVYYSLFPRAQENETERKPVTFVTARIDSASIFDGVSPGAASSVVGMVTLISTAATLSKMIPVADEKLYANNILWTLFNGESFDYIGSQRVAYDISRGSWPPVNPLSLSDIKLHVEIGQLGGSLDLYKDNVSWPLYAFTGNVLAQEIIEFLNDMTQTANLTVSPILTTNLPPSSLHSFKRILNATDMPELLLVDHRETFTNMYYESALDMSDTIDYVYHNLTVGSGGEFIPTSELLSKGNMTDKEPQVKISRIANALAQTLYKRVTGKPFVGVVDTSAHMVDEMLHCFLQTSSCRLLQAADFMGTDQHKADGPAPLYVGVATWASTPAVYAGHLLALLTGVHLDNNKTVCDELSEPGFSYYYLRGWNNTGVCIQTTMNFSQAVSPAFIKTDYDFTSNEFSTWTESVWQTMWARVFVTAGGSGAKLAGITGAIATIIAAFITYWLSVNSAVVFPSSIDAPNPILRSVSC